MFGLLTPFNTAIAVVLLSLCLACWYFHSENVKLIKDNATLVSVNQAQAATLKTCSDATTALKAREDEISKNAEAAITLAKEKAISDYKASNDTLFRKPKDPVVTKDNAAQYGGTDKAVQLKDYLETQDLVNDLITKKAVVK